MPKHVTGVLLGLSILAMGATAATADQVRRPNFFDLLFGTRPQSAQSPYNQPQRNWWERNGAYAGDPALSNIGKARRAANIALGDAGDPETVKGLGYGTVTYEPPVMTPVFDSSFIALSAATPDAEAIRITLADKTTAIKAVDAERKAVLAFYKTNGFKPVWLSEGQLTPRATETLKTLSSAGEDGLLAKNYLPEVLPGFDNPETSIGSDAAKQARLDVGLTVAALHYARQISGGQFDPARMSLYNDLKPEAVNVEEALKALADPLQAPATYLQSLAPKHPQYAIFKAELARLSSTAPVQFEPIKDGAVVKPGKSDPRVPTLRARLEQLGFIGASQVAAGEENKLDQDLVIGLMAFQTSANLKPSGQIDAKTLKAINTDNDAQARQKLVYSMERLRWLPKNLGLRHVFVNQPAYDVHVMDGDKVAWKSRVIVGQPTKQTYSFSNQIQTVVFNPKWGVPASIIINEYAPKMRRDPGYLDRNGFIVVDLNGNEIGSNSVDWYNVSATPNFGLQQLAGDGNALGELKFLFPNAHDIYMHDTPTKNLFNDPVRALSHGCVRVQNPREFAQVLLGWNKEAVARSLLDPSTHSVQLPQKVPVHLAYFTAWTDDEGKIKYYDDIYGRDAAMAKAFAYGTKPGDGNIVAQGSVSGGLIQN